MYKRRSIHFTLLSERPTQGFEIMEQRNSNVRFARGDQIYLQYIL